jgi:subtilisin family serine protease
VNALRLRLDHQLLAAKTGRGVRVAVIDSGVASGHPHVGIVTEGIAITADGESPDFSDRLGHGTAVTAAIREKAPAAGIVAVKVFDRTLATSAEVLARAIVRAAGHGVSLINLSLGTTNPARESVLRSAVERAAALGALIVAARAQDGAPSFPGSFPDVIGVAVGWELDRDEVEVDATDGPVTLRASGYPRPIPGVPRERNLSGISFAVANVTGLLARTLEGIAGPASVDALATELRALCLSDRGAGSMPRSSGASSSRRRPSDSP